MVEPTRVCPRCSTLTATTAARCPHCQSSYRRRRPWAGWIALALVNAALVLGGVAAMLSAFGDELEATLDDQVEEVEDDFGRRLTRVQRAIERQLDERLPAPGALP